MGLVDAFGRALDTAQDAADRLILSPEARMQKMRERLQAGREAEAQMWVGFDASLRTPEPGWQAELDRLCPRVAGRSWLFLRWFAGYPWDPAHRWVIYQMSAKEQTPDLVLKHLEGPDPRSLGYYDKRRGEFISVARVSRTQWDIYQETSHYAATYWIIQGSHGGHKAKFTKTEAGISYMNGGPQQPPAPGALPYAPFDARVVGKLHQHRAIQDYVGKGLQREKDEEEATKKMREMLWDFLSTQVMEELDGKDALLRRAFPKHNIRRAPGVSLAKLEEQGREQFIHDE